MHRMRVYEIDGASFDTVEGFYDEVSRVLVPDVSWGRNLDAFDDVLSGGFGTPDEGFIFRWLHHEVSRGRLRQSDASWRLDSPMSPGHRIADLNVFDQLVQIIRSHEADSGVRLELA